MKMIITGLLVGIGILLSTAVWADNGGNFGAGQDNPPADSTHAQANSKGAHSAPAASNSTPETVNIPPLNPNRALVQVQVSAYGSTSKSERAMYTTDFIVPLYYSANKDTLLFYNPKDTFTTPTANEMHQGLGIRHIFDDQFILGVNAFFDRRQTNVDGTAVWSSQTGIGVEYLSHPLDVRANWYKPTTRYKVVSQTGACILEVIFINRV
ncbi:MAG: inverse autotransporter beta domain-containing protein [Candidatus Omnitrophica bacterium]|nr:inverse autotransporter beta domain-containing protein [Candidatus Omnitrophota bacterium]